MTRTVTDNTTLVRGAYEAFARGDVPTVLGLFDEQIEWNEAEGNPWHPGRPFIGPQQVVEGVFARIPESWEDFQIQTDRFQLDAISHVECRGALRCVHLVPDYGE